MILQRYILKELLWTFVFALGAITAVCLVGTFFQLTRSFEGLQLSSLGKAVPLAVGYVAPWTLLAATCTAATLVYGRLAAANEINAMRATGLHPIRILAPALLFGALVSWMNYAANEYVWPHAHYARRMALDEAVLLLLRCPPPGSHRFEIEDYKLAYADYRDGRMERPYIMKFSSGRLEAEYQAADCRAVIREGAAPKLILSHPTVAQYDPQGGVTRTTAEGDITLELKVGGPRERERRLDEMSDPEIQRVEASTPDDKKRLWAQTILHSRRARALAPLFLVLVAVPVGVAVRRDSRMAGLGAAMPPLVVYFVLQLVFQAMSERGQMSPAVAAHMPNGVFLVLGALLVARTCWK